MIVTLRLQIDVQIGKKLTRKVFEHTTEYETPPTMESHNLLELQKNHAFGMSCYLFDAESIENNTITYQPQKHKQSSAFLRNLPEWGFREVVMQGD